MAEKHDNKFKLTWYEAHTGFCGVSVNGNFRFHAQQIDLC